MPSLPPTERAEVRPGVELAYWRGGRGRLPAAARARLARDEADLVAQHRAARRGGLRGDRRRTCAGSGTRVSPPDGFYDLAAHARDLHALVHEVLGHERCAAAGGDLGGGVIAGPRPALPGLRRAPGACSTVLPVPARGVRGGRASPRRRRARSARPPTTSSARAATPTGSPPSSTRPSGAGATSRVLRSRASGPSRARSARGRRLHDRAVRRRRRAARLVRQLRVARRARARCASRRASSSAVPVPTLSCTAPRTT